MSSVVRLGLYLPNLRPSKVYIILYYVLICETLKRQPVDFVCTMTVYPCCVHNLYTLLPDGYITVTLAFRCKQISNLNNDFCPIVLFCFFISDRVDDWF